MAKAKAKTAAATVPVPQSMDEARDVILEIGKLQRVRTLLETEMNNQLEELRRPFEHDAHFYSAKIKQLSEGLAIWAAANRALLTKDGKTKTAVLATGELRWRMTPPAVSLKNVKDVLAALAKARLGRFIRTKEEVDKEAVLREPDAVAGIPGIKVGQHEEFVIVPNETKLEEVA
ncbi:MAG TPA: host-nuclease inhibitor Gam family protein [Stellaceae bacterium]|jgi:phage host-nuclease inhibitor protein Gam